MVDVGDDRDVPQLGHGGNGRGSRFELDAFCAPRVTSAVLASGVMTDERIDELIDGLTYEPTEDEKELERRVASAASCSTTSTGRSAHPPGSTSSSSRRSIWQLKGTTVSSWRSTATGARSPR
jgi:hypothetical protein